MNFSIIELVFILGTGALLLLIPVIIILVIWNVIKGYRSTDTTQEALEKDS
ncbi:Uncharacterised protein [Corynebacterium kutscheri]|uniref:Uncharacterized protein n=1 Tax=Corynebacterium kutscheri TaxID=35755 RepID=A0A0F6QYP1_9CORY|nr:hypothetical protein [Corynebacterium kutscheri]AKE40260.1 hypothetical protein UL82_00080 [Corynebacterium kutscheri]VEH05564.1 Uncharacterised protein [Corynebacterium kutscheri]VEH10652.1 Uncharacterised protein [Corynebacterium kutscheri]VEH81458.1 Uncharacterised protein [Corynebacterium kutscheri]